LAESQAYFYNDFQEISLSNFLAFGLACLALGWHNLDMATTPQREKGKK
jgi:hypothetical protein